MKNTITLLFAAWVILTSSVSVGDRKSAMMVPDWESVTVVVDVDDECPVEDKLVRDKWMGELLRARLKPHAILTPNTAKKGDFESFENGGGTIRFTLSCMMKEGVLEPDLYVFVMDSEWLFLNQYDETSILTMRGEHGFWIVGAPTITDDIREHIEAAITKYLEANLSSDDT